MIRSVIMSRGSDPNQLLWERRLSELLEFRRREGHVNVPRGSRLGTWVANQRRLIGADAVAEHRLRLLRDAGVSWEGMAARRGAQQAAWDRMYGALRTFHRTTGHLDVPRGWSAEPTLAAWIATQRFLRKSGALAADRVAKLEALGFEWRRPAAAAVDERPRSPRAASWEQAVQALRDYRSQHGDCAVPARWPKNRKLAQWVANQRFLRKQGRLSRERIDELDRLGFLWSAESRRASALDRSWEDRFNALKRDAKDPALAAWIARQRNDYRSGALRPDRRRRLESIQFDWSPTASRAAGRKKNWETMFAGLKSRGAGRDRELARWLAAQRRLHQKGRLSAERARRLEQAGVRWTSREQKWEAKYSELQAWRRTHGDCNVPMAAEKGGALARWVSAQRAGFKSGRLAAERIARLEAIGFVWDGAQKSQLAHAH